MEKKDKYLDVVCDVSQVWRILLLPTAGVVTVLTLFLSILDFQNNSFLPNDRHDVEFLLDVKLTTAPFITLMLKHNMFFFTV